MSVIYPADDELEQYSQDQQSSKLQATIDEYRTVILKQGKEIEWKTEHLKHWEDHATKQSDRISQYGADIFNFQMLPWYKRVWKALTKQWP